MALGIRSDPLDEALEEELVRFHRFLVRVWLVVLGGAMIAASFTAIFVSLRIGIAYLSIAGAYYLWFTFLHLKMRRGRRLGRLLSVAAEVIQGTVPWGFLLVLSFVKGPAYALSSWVPPMLFAMLVFGQMLRLRKWGPLVLGISGALAFPALYFLLMRDRIAPEFSSLLLYQGPMQISRALVLLGCGALATMASQALRRLILRAGTRVRERDLFGKYRLISPIAQGGMGEVFEALYCPEGGFETRVALKRIHRHLAKQKRFVQLFRREAKLSSLLAHRNVVRVMDFGRMDDTYFLAMEYVDGLTLQELMTIARRRGTALPPSIVGAIVREVLFALHHAHVDAVDAEGRALHIIHRDVCPHNVLVSKRGAVKLTDFGVARALGETATSHTGTVVGHAGYMAPEQARAERIDIRVDIFSLGIVAWELLTGEPLFVRDNDSATVLALINDDIPSASSRRPSLDKDWDTFVGRALSRDRDQRYESAREMRLALDQIRSSHSDMPTQEVGELVTAMQAISDEIPFDESEVSEPSLPRFVPAT